MKRAHRLLALAVVVALLLVPAPAWPGSLRVTVSGGALHVSARGATAAAIAAGGFLVLSSAGRTVDFGTSGFSGPTYLIVDATPLEAQVFLDGRPLGTAQQLVARALPLAPGRHTVEIAAPSFRPYVARFTAVPGGFPIRVQVVLTPE